MAEEDEDARIEDGETAVDDEACIRDGTATKHRSKIVTVMSSRSTRCAQRNKMTSRFSKSAIHTDGFKQIDQGHSNIQCARKKSISNKLHTGILVTLGELI